MPIDRSDTPAVPRMGRRTILQALGAVSTLAALPPLARAATGRPASVVVLGAGIAGLVAARELEARGVTVTVLEARPFAGGRVWTVRGGDSFSDTDGITQHVTFAEGLYQNAGAARIPSHHQGILGLARDLNVRLEPLVNASRSAWLADPAGRIRIRQAVGDLRGHLSELLETALRQGVYDSELNPATRTALAKFLLAYGDLDAGGRFRGTERSGLASPPGAFDEKSVAVAPRSLDQILANPNLAGILFEENILMQATMLAPRGGMDLIPRALAASLRRPVITGAEVREIRRNGAGVRIVWRDAAGQPKSVEADRAIITLPFPVLRGVASDFSAPVVRAIAATRYAGSVKVAFESAPFWEADQIYGGLSFTGGATGVIWYPSDHFQAPRQVLLAAYTSRGLPGVNQAAVERFLGLGVTEQIEAARNAVETVHPGHGRDLDKPVVINWARQPYSLGPWIDWDQDGNDLANFRLLNQPDGPFLFAGSHLSQYSGHWQEGAVLSARRAVDALIPQSA